MHKDLSSLPTLLEEISGERQIWKGDEWGSYRRLCLRGEAADSWGTQGFRCHATPLACLGRRGGVCFITGLQPGVATPKSGHIGTL